MFLSNDGIWIWIRDIFFVYEYCMFEEVVGKEFIMFMGLMW